MKWRCNEQSRRLQQQQQQNRFDCKQEASASNTVLIYFKWEFSLNRFLVFILLNYDLVLASTVVRGRNVMGFVAITIKMSTWNKNPAECLCTEYHNNVFGIRAGKGTNLLPQFWVLFSDKSTYLNVVCWHLWPWELERSSRLAKIQNVLSIACGFHCVKNNNKLFKLNWPELLETHKHTRAHRANTIFPMYVW